MPIYEYRCTDGHTFDVFQSMSDDPVTTCEVCGKPVQRVLHSPAVHFKGSGFYTTDYGKGSKGKNGAKPSSSSDSKESKDKSSSSSSSSSSSDSGKSSESKSSSKSSDS